MGDMGKVKLIGRTFMDDGILWLSYSGSGIGFSCDGDLSFTFVGDSMIDSPEAEIRYPRYAIIRDGETVLDDRLSEHSCDVVIESEGRHDYRILKLSESGDSSLGIRDLVAPAIAPEPPRDIRIEVVGDSITSGYGVEGSLSETYTTATENVMKAWESLLAERMNADLSIVSRSGAGVVSGYTADGAINTDNLIVGCYDTCGCSRGVLPGGLQPYAVRYDRSFRPDIVLINIGTNDISFCRPVDETGAVRIEATEEQQRRRLFYSDYKQFVRHIRKYNPLAIMVCMLGVLGSELNPEVRLAVDELRLEGDTRIFMLPLDVQDPDDGLGTDYHPSAVTQAKLADRVYEFLQTVIR